MIRSKKKLNTFIGGIDQDVIVTKMRETHYFDAQNMRIVTNESNETGGVSTVDGNILKLQFDIADKIIGFCKIRALKLIDSKKDSIVFFVHNDADPTSKIYLFEGDPNMVSEVVNMNTALTQSVSVTGYTFKSGYIFRNTELGFHPDYPIKAEGRYEADNLRKVYWVDGLNNIRYMILDRVDELDDPEIFNINPEVELTAPIDTLISGGGYLAGKVQHSYQLYVRNGAATTFAPVSNMLSLTSEDGGPDSRNVRGQNLGENSGKAVSVELTNLDSRYNRVRIVALHYQEFLINPTVNIVGEYEYLGGLITVIDNGITNLGTIPIEEFRLFGQTNYIANYLAEKNNYLFFADIIEDKWSPDFLNPDHEDFFDCRAVRFGNITEQAGSGSDAILSFGSRDSVNGVSFDAAGQANRFFINIPDITTEASFPMGYVIDDITSITPDTPEFSPFIYLEWYTKDAVLHTASISFDQITAIIPFSYTNPDLSIRVSLPVALWTLGVNPSDFDYFTNQCTMYEVIYGYDYTTAGSTVIKAKLTDTSLYTVNITEPANPAVKADWDAAGWDTYAPDHNGINIYNDFGIDNFPIDEFGYNFQSDGLVIGAEGPNVIIDIATEKFEIDNAGATSTVKCAFPYADTQLVTDRVSSARTEVYRIYLVFYNTKMQFSNPQWVCDFRMPNNNEYNLAEMENITQRTLAQYLYPEITLRNMPADPELYGWQVFRCERGSSDRSVMANGLISPLVEDPYELNVHSYSWVLSPFCYVPAQFYPTPLPGFPATEKIVEIISPEISFNKNLKYSANDFFRIDGRYTNQKDFSVVVDNGTGENSNLRRSLIIQSTSSSPKTDKVLLEEWLYKATEGYFQAPAEWTGAPLTPTWPSSQFIEIGNLKNYGNGNIITSPFGTVIYRGNGGYSFVAVNGDNALIIDPATDGWLYGSYLRDVFSVQYGGNTFEGRSYNQVIPYSPLMLKSELATTCIYGDTYICMYTHLKAGWPYLPPGDILSKGLEEVITFPVETSINLFYRNDNIYRYYQPLNSDMDSSVFLQNTVQQGLKLQPVDYPLELGDLYRYNSVYSNSGNALTIQNLPFDSNMNEHDDTKVIASGKKFNNEYQDQWTRIFGNNFITVDSRHGPIRNIFNFNGQLYSGQDKGIAVLSVNDRSLIQDNSQLQLTLGTGEVLARYDYLTTTSGFQDYFDMGLSDKGFYYIDRRAKTFYNLTAEQGDVPISELKGYRSFMKKYGNISEVKTGYDPLYKEFFFYVSDGTRSYNSVYGELTSAFTGKHTFIPDRMLQLNDQFYSAKDNGVWIHNQGLAGMFYGVVSDSFIEMIINPEATNICRFDILDLRVDVIDSDGVTMLRDEQFDEMILTNNYQTTNKTILWSGDDSAEDTSKNIVGQWRTWLLPDDQSADFYRFSDTHLNVKLIKGNIPNHSITLHDITTFYRPTKN